MKLHSQGNAELDLKDKHASFSHENMIYNRKSFIALTSGATIAVIEFFMTIVNLSTRPVNLVSSRGQCYKLFTDQIYGFLLKAIVFFAGNALQPNITFLVKAKRLPNRGESERYFTRVGFGIAHKHKTTGKAIKGQILAYYKHS